MKFPSDLFLLEMDLCLSFKGIMRISRPNVKCSIFVDGTEEEDGPFCAPMVQFSIKTTSSVIGIVFFFSDETN